MGIGDGMLSQGLAGALEPAALTEELDSVSLSAKEVTATSCLRGLTELGKSAGALPSL